MIKKILLTTDFYPPNNSANGLCIYRLAKAFREYGYEVHVIAFRYPEEPETENMDGIMVHKFRPHSYFITKNKYNKEGTLFSKVLYSLQVILRRGLKVLFLPWFPMAYPGTIIRYAKKIEEIAKKENIRNIILSYNPLESSAAVLFFKNLKSYFIVNCFLDTFTLTGRAHRHKFVRMVGYRWEKRLFEKSDLITNFSIYHRHFENRKYDKYRNKMMEMDVPLNFREVSGKTSAHEGILFLYTGSLSAGDREPGYMVNLFNRYYELHSESALEIYGSARSEDFSVECSEGIRWNGFRPIEEVTEARQRADFLINIGSRINTNVPSRILEHISTGKPVIHIYYRKDDPCLFYLRNYKYKLLVNADDEIEKNADRLETFVNDNLGKRVEMEELETLYSASSVHEIVNTMDSFFV